MKIVAVIPCLNEERDIAKVVKGARQFADVVVVSDDNSNDRSRERAEKAGAFVYGGWWWGHMGMGGNTRYGMSMAQLHHDPDVVVTMDGDGQHSYMDMVKLLSPVISGDVDMVVAVRGDDTPMPVYRRFGNWLILTACNFLSKKKFSDATCCFRVFNKESVRVITKCVEPRYGFATEILVKARARGLGICEVPVKVHYYHDRWRNSKAPPLRQGLELLWITVKWRLKIDMILGVKQNLYKAFRRLITPFRGHGLSDNVVIGGIYKLIVRHIMPSYEREVTVNGSRMIVGGGKRDSGGIAECLLYNMDYEPETTRLFNLLLKLGMNVVDIGANVGYYTLIASRLVGESGKVWAFEPEIANYNDLRRNILLNGYANIIAKQYAVSDYDGVGKLYVSRHESGVHSLVVRRDKGGSVVDVEVVSLDVALQGERVDFVKTDTEGNDTAVINGMRNIIKNNPELKLIVEWWPQSKGDLWGMLASLFPYIYLANEWEHKTYRIHSVEDAKRYVAKHGFSMNLLCCRSEIGELDV